MKREFSIEDGFQISMLFLMGFWWEFLKGKMINEGLIYEKINKSKDLQGEFECNSSKDVLHDDNDFFFLTVCDGTSDGYFESVIKERMHIPPIEQHQGLVVNEGMLFQLTIDFCDYFNMEYQKNGKDSLRFAINWLEDMRKDTQKHQIEWDMWNKAIVDVVENGKKSLGFF